MSHELAQTLVNNLTCSFVKTLKPYESARRLYSGGQDWLNANESPFSNNYQLDDSTFNRYPSCQPSTVIENYAQYAGVENEQVLMSRGADEGIECLIRAFCEPGKDSIVICPPTYGMYAISAETFNVSVEKVPLIDGFSLDTDSIISQCKSPKLIFVCAPNNPTGTLVEQEKLVQLLNIYANKALVVVDEAYIEFAEETSVISLLVDHPNLVILRTLSKGFALAGLRCGFTLAAPAIIETLLKVIAPYPVPEPVAQVAAQALNENGLARLHQQVDYLQTQKKVLVERIATLPQLSVVGGLHANFILVRAKNKQGLMDYLVSQGMLIRDQSKQQQLDNCLRISIGNEQQNERLLALIAQFYDNVGALAS
jgi:histidinol-phosphate aminotransferase